MHARRSWGRLLAVGCLVASACAPVPPPSRIELPARQFSVVDVKLPSGLQVLVENDPTTRVVASALVVSAGGADDPPGQEGLAHLVEHLTFRAHRPGKPSLATWLALHGIGGWNAITEMDFTSYYLVGSPDTLSAMVDAEVARMEAPLEGVDEEIFRAERGVVLAELHTRDESGRRAELGRALLSQLFSPTHPYARWVGGTPESVGKITLAQAQAWAELHYQPRRMTWVLAGALDRAETAALLEQRVPARLRDAAPSPQPPAVAHPPALDPPPPAPATLPTVLAQVTRPTLLVGWKLPPARDRMEPIIAMLPAMVQANAYVDGVSSAATNLASMDDAAVLRLELELQPDASPEEVWKRVKSACAGAWGGGSPGAHWRIESNFGQVRGAVVVGIARHAESIVNRALLRAQRARVTRSTNTLRALNEAIGALTYDDVLEAGRGNVTESGARAVLVKPLTAQESEGEQKETGDGSSTFAPEVVRAEYPAEALARFARGPRLEQVSTFQASNGLEVLTAPEPGSGLVTVMLGVRGGRLTSSPPALADRLAWSRQSWTYHLPGWIGADVSSWWTDDSGIVEYRGAAGNLPNLLAMLGERVLTRRTTSASKATLARTSATPEADEFNRRFWETLLGAPGGKAQLSVAQAAALDGDAAQRWAEQVLDPRTSVLVVAGDVKGNLRDEVEHWLGRWKGTGKVSPSDLTPLPPAPGVLRVVKATLPHGKQVRVRLGCTAAAGSLEDELAFTLLAEELKRQWTKLERETLGSSYGFQSAVRVRRDGSMRLLVWGGVENGSARRMAVAVSQAWKALGDLGADESRVNRLRWEYARGYNVRFLTAAAVADEVVRHRLRGRPATALDEVPAALKRVGREQMAGVGKQCQASAVLGLLGDATALDVDAQLPKDAQAVR